MSTLLDNPIDLGSLYRLTETIGKGATGVVYRGVNKETGESIAAKILHAQHTQDPQMLTQFFQEKTLLTSLNHSAIVTVRDLVIEGNTLAIVTEFVNGYSLREYLNESGNLPPYFAGLIVTHILSALDYAHKAGVTHRDIKPDNILLTHTWQSGVSGSIKLADFGISKLIGSTDAAQTIGTPAYMPPELWAKHTYDSAGDIYETGITLYELLAGHTPFPAGLAAHHHEHSAVPQLDLPAPLWAIVSAMLAKRPEDRPTASQALADLQSILPEIADLGPLPLEGQSKNYVPATILKTTSSKNKKDKNVANDKETHEIIEKENSIPAALFNNLDVVPEAEATQLSPVSRRQEQETQADNSSEEKTKKKKVLIIAASVLAVLAIGSAAVVAVLLNTHNKHSDHASAKPKPSVTATSTIVVAGDSKVEVGQSVLLQATIETADTSDNTLVWSSSDESVAVVDETGKVTGVKAGKTTITATTKNGSDTSEPFEIEVLQPITSIALSGDSVIEADETVQLNIGVEPADASDASIVWSSSDESVAVVDEAGKVTGIKAGKATITATSQDSYGKSGSLQITVKTHWVRLGDKTGYSIMTAATNATFNGTGGTVIIASSSAQFYYDSLAANGIAGINNAPILLTNGTALTPDTRDLIVRLKPKNIIVLGGTRTIADKVLGEIKKAAPSAAVSRCWGQDAYETANAIADAGKGRWSTTAFVVNSRTYTDAMSIAPYVYKMHTPVFYAKDGTEIPSTSLAKMKELGIKHVYIIGDINGVATSVESQIKSGGMTFSRIGGRNAIDTSRAFAEFAISQGMSVDTVGISTTATHVDAVVAGPFLGSRNSVLVLTNSSDFSAIDAIYGKNKARVSHGYIFGTTDSVSTSVEAYVSK